MKKVMILLVLMIFLIVSCSKEASKVEIGTNLAESQSSDTSTVTGAAIVDLSPINITCENIFNPKTVIDLTPSKELVTLEVVKNITVNGKQKSETKKETKVQDGPSEFINSKLETKTLTFDHKTVSEQSCEFAPASDKRIGRNTLKLRFVCGPKDKLSQNFNQEKSDSRSIQEGSTGIASFWAVKKDEVVYSLLSGKVDCFVDVEGVDNLELGEAIGKEIEGNLG